MKKRLKEFLHSFEHFTNAIIPYLLIGLGIILIIDNPLWSFYPLHHLTAVHIFDYFIVFFFVVDLIYKWYKTRHARKFLKLYWLDIVAVFPFYLVIRAYAELLVIFRSQEFIETGQKVAHEVVLAREAELVRTAKESRLLRESNPAFRALRGVQRFLRILKGRLYATHRSLMQVHQYGRKH